MSLATGFTWTHKNIKLLGYSMAGITTSVAFPEADVLFDVGQGLPWQMGLSNILLTHGHMDHASGIPYLIGQKAMSGSTPPMIYMPPTLLPSMRELMRIWERVEDHTYQYQFIGIEEGKEYKLKGPFYFKSFPTYHRVPSCGYTVFEKKKSLKDEYKGLERDALIELRKKGVELEELREEPLVSFTGDTRIEFLDGASWVKKSKVLVMEVTFVDEAKSVENARYWGHIHLDELLPRLESLQCEKVVLIHLSARYPTKRVREIIEARVPEHLKSRIEIFPRPV